MWKLSFWIPRENGLERRKRPPSKMPIWIHITMSLSCSWWSKVSVHFKIEVVDSIGGFSLLRHRFSLYYNISYFCKNDEIEVEKRDKQDRQCNNARKPMTSFYFSWFLAHSLGHKSVQKISRSEGGGFRCVKFNLDANSFGCIRTPTDQELLLSFQE